MLRGSSSSSGSTVSTSDGAFSNEAYLRKGLKDKQDWRSRPEINEPVYRSEDDDAFVGVTQVSVELQYNELWPGAVDGKLGHYGGSLLDRGDSAKGVGVWATDAMGVELDLRSDRLPEPDQFPLKVHFRAGFCGPQNVGNEEAARFLASGAQGVSQPGGMFDHSLELGWHGILDGVINRKLRSVGLLGVGCERPPAVLVTDCLGVVVEPAGGPPDVRRFPLKLYLSRQTLLESAPPAIQNNGTASRWRPWRTAATGAPAAAGGHVAEWAREALPSPKAAVAPKSAYDERRGSSGSSSSEKRGSSSVMSTMGSHLAAMKQTLLRSKTV